MELGPFGLKLVGVWRQPRQGEPFAEWAECDLRLEPVGRVGQILTARAWPKKPGAASAVRVRLFVPFEKPEEVLVHHPALVRMLGIGSRRVGEPWNEGERSDLAADAHFEMDAGGPPFGMPPIAIFAHPVGARFAVSALRERHARASFAWRLAEGGIEVDVTFTRVGRPEYAYSKAWPNEPILLSFEPHQRMVARFEDSWLGALYVKRHMNRALAGLGQYVRTGPLVRNELMWGSWNDGIYREIDQKRVLGTAQWLSQNVPKARWIQIDDGWAPIRDEAAPMSDLGVFYDPDRQSNDPRFPEGMAGLARAIKALGLRPMLWLTPAVHERSKLYREQPDWFQPETRLYFMPELRFLDTSVPAAREFLEVAFHTAFREWGFEGCKLDFWTMGFDQPDVAYRNPEADGVSEMQWFVRTLRRFMPADGLLLHCIDIPFGSPFRAVGFDAFRYYADSEGACRDLEKMKEQALWAAYLSGLYLCASQWVPDGDGMGLFRHFEMPDSHFSLWLAFLVGSGSLIELAGWLHAAEGDPRRDQLLKALPHVAHGAALVVPGFDFAQRDREPPRVWFRRDGMRRPIVALTNWSAASMRWSAETQYGADGRVKLRDVQTGEEFDGTSEIEVAPESGRLLTFL